LKKTIGFFGFAIGVICLAAIRLFEKQLFHDPLLEFYHGDFLKRPFPDLNFWIYSLNLCFRYALNTLASLLIIWIAFKKWNYIKFSLLFYLIVFVTCFVLFWIIENNIDAEHYMRLFYVRRFLIQPLLVIVLLPAFYFQQLNKKTEE
jgi:exosortase F-associated protein